MKNDSIKLSPEHGLNPSITLCPICKKEVGVALLGELEGDAEAPKYIEGTLCDDCRKNFLEIREAKDSHTLTGRIAYIERKAVKEELRDKNVFLMLEEEFDELFKNYG